MIAVHEKHVEEQLDYAMTFGCGTASISRS